MIDGLTSNGSRRRKEADIGVSRARPPPYVGGYIVCETLWLLAVNYQLDVLGQVSGDFLDNVAAQ